MTDFSAQMNRAYTAAGELAVTLGHAAIGSEHLLFGLASSDGRAGHLLREAGADQQAVLREVEAVRGRQATSSLDGGAARGMTADAADGLQQAVAMAEAFGHPQVEAEHLLVGLLLRPRGVLALLLHRLGIATESLREDALAVVQPDAAGRVRETRTPAAAWAVDAYELLIASEQEARRLRHDEVWPAHMLLAFATTSVTFRTAVGSQRVHPGDVHDAVGRRLGVGDVKLPATLTWSHAATAVAESAEAQTLEQRAGATTQGMLFDRLLWHGGLPVEILLGLGLSLDELKDAFR